MGCNCGGGGRTRERWVVTLPNGLKVTKTSESQAKSFADRHPGSSYVKVS